MPKHAYERGMLFDVQNVLSIIDGRKTQTRRVVRPANSLINGRSGGIYKYGKKEIFKRPEFLGDAWVDDGPSPAGNTGQYLKCPMNYDDTVHRVYCHIQPGDELWVQEKFVMTGSEPVYAASCTDEFVESVALAWGPAGEMAKEHSRIRLKVIAVRVERLGDISPDNALAQGYPLPDSGYAHTPANRDMAKDEFLRGKWAKQWVVTNPWVWVITFKRVG